MGGKEDHVPRSTQHTHRQQSNQAVNGPLAGRASDFLGLNEQDDFLFSDTTPSYAGAYEPTMAHAPSLEKGIAGSPLNRSSTDDRSPIAGSSGGRGGFMSMNSSGAHSSGHNSNKQSNDDDNQSDEVVYDLNIPRDYAGVVIGRGGETIKRIQAQTSTKIQCSSDDPTVQHRVFHISGPQESVLQAQGEIRTLVEQAAQRNADKALAKQQQHHQHHQGGNAHHHHNTSNNNGGYQSGGFNSHMSYGGNGNIAPYNQQQQQGGMRQRSFPGQQQQNNDRNFGAFGARRGGANGNNSGYNAGVSQGQQQQTSAFGVRRNQSSMNQQNQFQHTPAYESRGHIGGFDSPNDRGSFF